MAIHSERSLQKKDKSTSFSPKKRGLQAFQLADQRKEASQQRQVQQMADNSPQTMNLKSLQSMAHGKSGGLFHAILAASNPGTLEEVSISGGNNAGDATKDLGTTDLQNAQAPGFQVNLVKVRNRSNHFRAQVAKTQDAYEGDTTSMYVKGGTYYSNYLWDPDEKIQNVNNRLKNPIAILDQVDRKHVYIRVSSAIAKLSRDAENEHLNDFRQAYNISIGALDNAIDTVIAQMPQNGYLPSSGSGYTGLFSARNDVFERIKRLLPVKSRNHISSDETTWLDSYIDLTKMTKDRDDNGWHTFDLQKSGFWFNNQLIQKITESWDIYSEHPETKIQYLDAVKGDDVNINAVPSATVVHF